MGWSVGASLGAKKAHPEKLVVAIVGEEAFNETALDIETSVRNEAPVLIIVKNNAALASGPDGKPSRLAQARFRQTIDVVALAGALGAKTFKVEQPNDIAPCLRAAIDAVEAGNTAVVEILTTRIRPVLHPLWEGETK